MKKFVLIIVFYSITTVFAQNDTVNSSFYKFFITPSFKYNLPGAGFKLSVGYNIMNDFSIILSSGYMTLFRNSHSGLQESRWDDIAKDYLETTSYHGDYTRQFIPVDLSLRYNFEVWGVQSYVSYQAGWNYFFNEGTYNVTLVTKYKNSNQITNTKSGKAADIYNYSKTNSSFGDGLGFGVLVPLTDIMKIDFSCSFLRLSTSGPIVLSLGAGLNFVIK